MDGVDTGVGHDSEGRCRRRQGQGDGEASLASVLAVAWRAAEGLELWISWGQAWAAAADGGGHGGGSRCRCFELPPISKFLILRIWLGWCA